MQNHSDVHSAVSPEQPSGPVYPYLSGFEATLRSQGYSEASIDYRLCTVRALDPWMRKHRMRIEDLTEERIERFFRDRGRSHSKQTGECVTLRSLLVYLREPKVVRLVFPTTR